jgi:hypothetical protein
VRSDLHSTGIIRIWRNMLCGQISVEHPCCAGQAYELHIPESSNPNFRVRGYQCCPARFKGGSEAEAITLRRQLHSDAAKESFVAATFYLFGDPGLPVGYRTFRVNFSSFGYSFPDLHFLVSTQSPVSSTFIS